MKSKFLALFMVFLCGEAFALPQDWPCKTFELEKVNQVKDDNLTDYHVYRGEDGDYILRVNIFWQKDMKSDDCGTAGCNGTIKNVKTGQEESLNFFCDAEKDYNAAKCYIKKGEEYILQKISDEYYQADLCDSTVYKYVQLSECSGCTCIVHDSQKGNSDIYMGCKKSKNSLHCMTGNIYEEKYNPNSDIEDFKNCVGLTTF